MKFIVIFSKIYKPSRAELEKKITISKVKQNLQCLGSWYKSLGLERWLSGKKHGLPLQRTMVPFPIPSIHLVAHICLKL